MSRQTSEISLSSEFSLPAPVSFGDDSMSPFGDFDDDFKIHEQRREEDDMIRITYEDPGQREERRRLMGLMKAKGGGKDEVAVPMDSNPREMRTRRSSRIAGF